MLPDYLSVSYDYDSHDSQTNYYNTNWTVTQNSDRKIQAFKLKHSKNSLAHCLSASVSFKHIQITGLKSNCQNESNRVKVMREN